MSPVQRRDSKNAISNNISPRISPCPSLSRSPCIRTCCKNEKCCPGLPRPFQIACECPWTSSQKRWLTPIRPVQTHSTNAFFFCFFFACLSCLVYPLQIYIEISRSFDGPLFWANASCKVVPPAAGLIPQFPPQRSHIGLTLHHPLSDQT